MNKIKTIMELREAKKSLAKKQHELEKDIAGKWHEIKDKTLNQKQNLRQEKQPASPLENIMAGALAFAGGLLAKKIAHKISLYLSRHSKN